MSYAKYSLCRLIPSNLDLEGVFQSIYLGSTFFSFYFMFMGERERGEVLWERGEAKVHFKVVKNTLLTRHEKCNVNSYHKNEY